jgi:hypothetical protein
VELRFHLSKKKRIPRFHTFVPVVENCLWLLPILYEQFLFDLIQSHGDLVGMSSVQG